MFVKKLLSNWNHPTNSNNIITNSFIDIIKSMNEINVQINLNTFKDSYFTPESFRKLYLEFHPNLLGVNKIP